MTTSTATLLVRGDRVPLPVEVRDSNLGLVATGSVGQQLRLPAGIYGISVPLPYAPEFTAVVDLRAGASQTISLPAGDRDLEMTGRALEGPGARGQASVDAAIALAGQGRLEAAVHVLAGTLGDLPEDALVLLGFTAIQLNDLDRAHQAEQRMTSADPDTLAFRAALHRAESDGDEASEAVARDLANRALDRGLPRLTVSARSLVAILRDNQVPATPQSRELVRLVRRTAAERVLRAPVTTPIGPPRAATMLTIDLTAPQGRALLTVRQPAQSGTRRVDFDLPPLTGDEAEPLVQVSTQVLVTRASNARFGWPEWFVKVYRCASAGDADTLRQHLHRQAAALQHVNNFLPGRRGRSLEPPWAVVPVQVVRGDGRLDQLAGAVTTRLGGPADQVAAQLGPQLPPWLGDDTRPDVVLLAVSPWIDELSWDSRPAGADPHPATEHLHLFGTVAAGLDLLHQQGWAHCDIKPDNVRRYTADRRTEYVLIDTDSATRTWPPPRSLRTTQLYEYRALRDQAPLRPGLLYAQDRFGLMLVVLCALAGRDWVEQIALRPDASDPGGGRIADDPQKMRRALAALWPDPRWEPLIRALAEPFGDEIALTGEGPWAAGWLGGLLQAETECVERSLVPASGTVLSPAARQAVERVWREVRAYPGGKTELVRRAYRAIEEAAHDLAARQARMVIWFWITVLTVLGLVIGLVVVVAGR